MKLNERIRQALTKSPTRTDKDVAKELKTTPDAIRSRRRRLGIIKPQAPSYRSLVGDVPLKDKLYELLRKGSRRWSVSDLADHFGVSPKKVKEAAHILDSEGKNIRLGNGVELLKQLPLSEASTIDVSKFKGQKFVFGLTSDNHLGSKYARLDVLNALFDIWARQGVTTVYQCGNMIDGEARFNRFDLLVPPGVEAQVDYFVENWPKRPGITTEFVTGDDHEGWYVRDFGLDIGRMIETQARARGREDLKYLGNMEHDIILPGRKSGRSVMRLIHSGGGSAYATSYAVQKIVESYQGGEKPQVLLVGHYHKAEYGYPREVHVVQAGCTEDQTPFMRKQKLQAHLGGWTISFELDDFGVIHAFTTQFHQFYDRNFYEKKWQYRFR